MLCIACGQATDTTPCTACGDEPRLDGRWSLLEVLGQGANGTTYKAVDADGHTVAAKESTLKTTDPEKVRELVEREARVLRQLTHDGVPSYVEEIWHQHGRSRSLFLLQEFVEGVDLQHRLDDHRYSEDEVLDLLDELAGILAHLHGRQPPIIHRDVKPSNVMRRPDGRHVLLDFGSVRDVLKDAHLGGSTVAGTFGFMAPEQFAGDASPQSDLYALGALAVALLTRQDPARLQRPDRSVGWHDHVAVSDGMTRLVDELLALEPAGRPASAQAVKDRIAAVRDGTVEAPDPDRGSWVPIPALLEPKHAPPAETRPRTAKGLQADEPETFHQPPVPHANAPLAAPPRANVTLPAGVGLLLILLMATAGFVVAGASIFVIADAPSVPTPTPIRAPLAVDAIVHIPDSPWPVMTPEELGQVAPDPTCRVIRTNDTQKVLVQDCPAPLTQQAKTWAEENMSQAPAAFPLIQTLGFLPRPDPSMLTPATTVIPLDEAAQGPYVERKATELTTLHREQPTFPDAAKGAAIATVKCVVDVDVGADGAPDRLTIRACPLPFHANTATAITQWRWDVPDPARTSVGVTYKHSVSKSP